MNQLGAMIINTLGSLWAHMCVQQSVLKQSDHPSWDQKSGPYKVIYSSFVDVSLPG